MTKFTHAQITAREIERKLDVGEGQTVTLNHKEACLLACYLRQRTSLLYSIADLSSLAARAIAYVLSIWKGRGSGEVYESVRFDLEGRPTMFYYNRILERIKAAQDLVKLVDPELEFGDYEAGKRA